MTKLDGDDRRLIRLGWLPRSTGLDELPQLFNVFRGDMSLVGPRPCTPREYSAYTLPQQARSETLPGLTLQRHLSILPGFSMSYRSSEGEFALTRPAKTK